jgi:DNA-binding transcriptional MerR regulator
MTAGQSFTLSDLARRLDAPQHQLIHLCEKGVVVPDFEDAHGRGSSRRFSERNILELAVALRLRAAGFPLSVAGAVLDVLRRFEARLRRDLGAFELPESLRTESAPDLRVIVSDGTTVYFSLGRLGRTPRLFGGIPLDQITGDRPSSVKLASATPPKSSRNGAEQQRFGGPEGSQFLRLELSVTEIARALPLD